MFVTDCISDVRALDLTLDSSYSGTDYKYSISIIVLKMRAKVLDKKLFLVNFEIVTLQYLRYQSLH